MSESEDADVPLLQVRNRHSPEAGPPPHIVDQPRVGELAEHQVGEFPVLRHF